MIAAYPPRPEERRRRDASPAALLTASPERRRSARASLSACGRKRRRGSRRLPSSLVPAAWRGALRRRKIALPLTRPSPARDASGARGIARLACGE